MRVQPILRLQGFSENWENAILSDVAVFFNGRAYKQNELLEKGKYPVLRVGNFFTNDNWYYSDLDLDENKYCDNGDLLYAWSASFGPRIWKGDKVIYHYHIWKVIPKGKIDKHFLYHLLSVETEKFKQKILNGFALQHITKGAIESWNVIFPTLPEQQKIASFLTSVDKRISQLKRKKQLLEQYKKGIMQQIFSQQLRFKREDGTNYPNWEKKKLSEVASYRRGSFPQPYGLPEWYDDENGMPFIQVYDVGDDFKLKPKTKAMISEAAMPKSVFIPKGTLIITIQGSIGRLAITEYDAYIDRTLLLFTSFNIDLDKVYFMYSLFLLFEIEKRKAPGGTIKTITKEVLSDFKIQVPCLEEQTKIANFLSAIDTKITQTQKQIELTQQFKKGLLQQMFV